MLKVENLVVSYGMIEAIKGLSFEVNDGEIVTLIGANGAGKTTTMQTISGLLKPVSGSITLDGVELTKVPAHKIVSLGLAQVSIAYSAAVDDCKIGQNLGHSAVQIVKHALSP